MRTFSLVALATLVAAGHGLQLGANAQEQQPRFGAGTTAVMVDVVVRDKQGRPVTDLTASDFQVLEDGVPQEIGAVTLVRGGAGSLPPAAAPAAEPGAAPRVVEAPTFVALIFDRLSPEARALAHKGAMAYLETARENDFAGVFLTDNNLVTLQTYTNDRSQVREAIDAAASRATSNFSRQADAVRSGSRGSTDPRSSPTAGAESAGPGRVSGGPTPPANVRGADPSGMGAMGEVELQRLADRMERSYETMMRDQQGYASINGLMAVVDALSLLPGRKTAVYFAEGLAIPPNVQARFDSVIAAANRANVSIYTVDAAGLRVHSSAAETARQVRDLGAAGVGDIQRDDRQAYTKDLELNEDVLRQDPSAALGMLADRTGGFLINNTNALERGFRTIDADRRFHYLLTYSPKNDQFNGEWRNVTVKVPGRDVQVRARSGYLAVRAPGALPLLAYEAPAAAALDRSPLPSEIPVRAGAFMFPQPGKPAVVAVLVAAEASDLTFEIPQGAQAFRTDFTVLARVKDATGEVVRKASQPYRLDGPAAAVDQARQGDVLFFRQPTLDPGTYTLEYAVYDALARKAGAGTASVRVPDQREGALLASSLLVVRRTEKVPEAERSSDNPLYHGDLLLYPNLGAPLSKARDKVLSFYEVVYPAAGGPAPTAVLELLQGGQVAAQLPLPLAAPGPDGRIAIVNQLPLANFPPGEYTLRVTVTQGAEKEAREAAFQVVE